MNPLPSSFPPESLASPLSPIALRREVVARLTKCLFQGELPAGSQLVVRKLAENLGVSATPVHARLVELESIGLVQFIHNRGAIAKPFGRLHLREIYHLRRILEVEAARCACGRIPPTALENLHDAIQQLVETRETENAEWSRRALALDYRLHDLIAEHCGDSRLASEIHRYHALMQTIREIVGNRRRTQQHALEEHGKIVDALLAQDAEGAAAAMARHIDSTAESVVAVMFPEAENREKCP